MGENILVVAEQRNGELERTSWEVLVAGQRLGKELGKAVSIVVVGHDIQNVAVEIAANGFAEVLVVDDERLAVYTPDGYCAALKQVIQSADPALVLFSYTYRVRDYGPKLSAALARPLLSDCVRVKFEDGETVFVHQIFQGKIDADFVFTDNGANLVSFQAGAFNADDLEKSTHPGKIKKIQVDFDDVDIRTRVHEIFAGVKQEVDLSKAERIVCVGRGIKGPENLEMINELAEVLGAEIAASRPVCDDGWLPLDRQIGSSGQTVAPRLYLAIGISGAIQHIVGMKNSGTIVAINKDQYAPIFDIADYGIVGDLFEMVPALTKALKEIK
jgi:electron transfer flavoprotein alpha subunit